MRCLLSATMSAAGSRTKTGRLNGVPRSDAHVGIWPANAAASVRRLRRRTVRCQSGSIRSKSARDSSLMRRGSSGHAHSLMRLNSSAWISSSGLAVAHSARAAYFHATACCATGKPEVPRPTVMPRPSAKTAPSASAVVLRGHDRVAPPGGGGKSRWPKAVCAASMTTIAERPSSLASDLGLRQGGPPNNAGKITSCGAASRLASVTISSNDVPTSNSNGSMLERRRNAGTVGQVYPQISALLGLRRSISQAKAARPCENASQFDGHAYLWPKRSENNGNSPPRRGCFVASVLSKRLPTSVALSLLINK